MISEILLYASVVSLSALLFAHKVKIDRLEDKVHRLDAVLARYLAADPRYERVDQPTGMEDNHAER